MSWIVGTTRVSYIPCGGDGHAHCKLNDNKEKLVELSYFETLQMINLSIDRLESVFEFWLSATFAAIVASHLAGDKLTKVYAGILTSLYLIFTFSVAVRSLTWAEVLVWVNSKTSRGQK